MTSPPERDPNFMIDKARLFILFFLNLKSHQTTAIPSLAIHFKSRGLQPGIWILLLSFWLLTSSCSPVSKKGLNKFFKKTEEKFQDHTGFVLYDLEKKKTLYEYNSSKYFTPASNTKIFTLYASLVVLGDSIPALKYIELEDSLIFWGTGDPSFLYKNVFTNDRVYSFLKHSAKPLYFSNANFHTSHLGSGWAWNDYNDYYSPERSPLPIYGNIVSIALKDTSVSLHPTFFTTHFTRGNQKEKPDIQRQVFSNQFTFHPGIDYDSLNLDIPFHIDQQTIINLLSDTLKRIVEPINRLITKSAKILYSVPADSLYKVMMQESDNFIAEQLLMICSGIISDTLQPEIAIKKIKQNFLSDLKDPPAWVDGSGLSRYNLFTPRSVIQLWEKIYEIVPRERLFPLLAIGGRAGTIKNWYKADSPYIFGKTGSLRNNHCLSGYLVAKSGRILIFSFMNSNFTASTNEVRRNMQTILKSIYETY